MRGFGRWLLASGAGVIALGLLGACTHPTRALHARIYKCPVHEVTATRAGRGRYHVRGCGHSMVYICPAGRTSCMRLPREAPVSVPTNYVRASTSGAMLGRIKEDEWQGEKRLRTKIRLNSKQDYLRLVAVAAKDKDHVLLELGKRSIEPALKSCSLKLMVNLSRRKVPESQYARVRTHDALRVKLPARLVAELAFADHAAFRACDTTWTLDRTHKRSVAKFIARFAEETAWNAPARDQENFEPPKGGWAAWSANADEQPSPSTTAVPDAGALYELLKPSVYRVRAGDRGGSAVAVSPTSLLTNCHVLAGADSFSIEQADTRLPAIQERSDPNTDRCVLRVEHPLLKPVPGVVRRSELKVGQAVYSLGAPEGFEATLGPGIISRLPEEEERLVQTTAPVSPGSSGGGLFDERGNLVGITTMIYVGASGVAQQLNFAIAADAFWQQSQEQAAAP